MTPPALIAAGTPSQGMLTSSAVAPAQEEAEWPDGKLW